MFYVLWFAAFIVLKTCINVSYFYIFIHYKLFFFSCHSVLLLLIFFLRSLSLFSRQIKLHITITHTNTHTRGSHNWLYFICYSFLVACSVSSCFFCLLYCWSDDKFMVFFLFFQFYFFIITSNVHVKGEKKCKN